MSERPNILFMIADDHRFDAIHAFGDPIVQTPVLDGLARRGVSFRQTHIMGGFVAAVCVPSRACLLTGANVFRASASNKVDDYAGAVTLNPALATLPATLRDAGYHTYAVGKWHNDVQSFAEGFRDGSCLFFGGMSDHWGVPIHDFDPSGVYPPEARQVNEAFSTELFTDAAIRFLDEYQRDDPFFLYLAFTAPHDPRTPPGEYANLYDKEHIPLPDNLLPEHPFDNGEMRIRDEQLAPWPRTPDVVRQHIADYYGMISHMDAQIGRILQALHASGRAENTIVVYTADHGLAVGQHGLLGKQNLYQHSIHIPLIIGGPGLSTGQQVEALVSNSDIFPTLCDLTDTSIPGTVEGQSLTSVMAEGSAPMREQVYAAYKDVQRMVNDGRWKLIRYYRSDERQVGTDYVQLFDLAADPGETQNLVANPDHGIRLQQLAADLANWQRSIGDPLADRPVLQ